MFGIFIKTLFVLTEVGLKFVFDVKTTLNISDVTFYPSRTTHGYDVYASAANKEDILFLNLENGELIYNRFSLVLNIKKKQKTVGTRNKDLYRIEAVEPYFECLST